MRGERQKQKFQVHRIIYAPINSLYVNIHQNQNFYLKKK